jgi:hypothetical protein
MNTIGIIWYGTQGTNAVLLFLSKRSILMMYQVAQLTWLFSGFVERLNPILRIFHTELEAVYEEKKQNTRQ